MRAAPLVVVVGVAVLVGATDASGVHKSVSANAAPRPGRATPATRQCPTPAARAIHAGELVAALRKLVPKYPPYGNMTNQLGEKAWRGYVVVSEFNLGWPRWMGLTYPQTYRRSAVHACGARVADASWVVIIQFPRSQALDLSTSAAYIVRTDRGLTIWREQLVKPQGWK
jgi:hypothetical protein